MFLANARSLVPKLASLRKTMRELDTAVALITETWMFYPTSLDNILTDLHEKEGLAFLRKDRSTQRHGGGVAICYDVSKIEMVPIKIPQPEFEVVAALGRRSGQRRKIAVVCFYIPPAYDADTDARFMDYLSDVLTIKNRFVDPYIAIAGDANRRDLRAALADYRDIKLVHTSPTRRDATLDLVPTLRISL